jgi:ubiquinone/menaquinone biosynthesis C-methylase UbiE
MTMGKNGYLPRMDVEQYLEVMRRDHPHIFNILDLREETLLAAAKWLNTFTEFEDDSGRGRGAAYRHAQIERTARYEGITMLLQWMGTGVRDKASILLDVLGGDGLMADVWRLSAGAARDGEVRLLTGDLSGRMVQAALDAGLPAVRQPAQRLLLKDSCVDGVVIAYGTHHIPRAERPLACREASRVLRRGSRLVLHDFEEKSPVAQWFEGVVHRYSPAGHPYEHFTDAEMIRYLRQCGLVDIRIERVYDPFRIHRTNAREAMTALLRYVLDMYGLRLLHDEYEDEAETMVRLRELLELYFRYDPSDQPHLTGWSGRLDVRRDGGGFVAELPRIALVASGVKP